MILALMLWSLFAIGFVSGLRSMTAPAAVAWAVHRHWLMVHTSLLSLAGSNTVTELCIMGAVGELVVDKMPWTPSRLKLPSLVVRAMLGGMSAAVLASAAERSLTLGAILGALGALTGSYAGFYARRKLVRATGGHDLPVALIEDVIAVALALFVVRGF